MIKIKVTEIEVDKQEFTEKVNELCLDLYKYLGVVYLTRERFNSHFKTKLTDLEFAKLMDDNWYEIEVIKGNVKVNILNSVNIR